MGFLSEVKAESRGSVTGGTSITKPASWLVRLLGGGEDTVSGITVNEVKAFNLSVFWCAVGAISADIAKLPFGVYVRRGDDRIELPDDPVAILMGREPNPESIPFAVRRLLIVYALVWGNGVAEIEWYNNGRPAALWPIHPRDVHITRDSKHRLVYEISSTLQGGRTVSLYPENVFHLFGLSFDGVTGCSIVQHARESLGLSLAAERFGAAFFGNGMSPSGIVRHPQRLNDEGAERIRKRLKGLFVGPTKARGIPIFEEGMSYEQIGIPPNDGQFLETRQFQIPEWARWFRMPPHKLMDLMRGTFSNIEHQSIEYVGDCLGQWITPFEQETEKKFFGRTDPRYCRHNVAGLLRSDLESRYRAYAIGRQWGWMSVDDVRALEDLNPLPNGGGKVYLSPLNMVPAHRLEELTDAQVKAKATPAPTADGSDPPPANPENGNQNRAAELARGFRAQVADAVYRMAGAAADKIQRAKRKGGFEAWVTGFYAEHRDHVRGAFFPLAEAVCSVRAAFGPAPAEAPTPNMIAAAMADRYIAGLRSAVEKGGLDAFAASGHEAFAEQETHTIEAIIAGGTP